VLSVTFASALTLQLVGLPIRVFSRAVTSHANYGFYGVQMGQREVFSWVRRNLDRYPTIHLSHAAFNGNEAIVDFYVPSSKRDHVPVRDADKVRCVLAGSQPEIWILRHEKLIALESGACPLTYDLLERITDPLGNILFDIVEVKPRGGLTRNP
jgi:hypothetical protein